MKNFTKVILFLCTTLLVMKAHARGNNAPETVESFRSNLYLVNPDNSLTMADGNLAQYDNSYSAAVDGQDVMKLSNINETFGLYRQNHLLAIERRPIIGITDTLFFNLTKTTQRNYQFQFIAIALNHPGLGGVLIDSYLGTSTPVDLNSTTTVNFNINSNAASQNPNRFMIVFRPASVTPVFFSGIFATQLGQDTKISWSVEGQLNIKQYNVERSTDGINFSQIATVAATGGSNVSSEYSWIDATTAQGDYFYRIASVGTDGGLLYSQVAQIKIGIASQSLTIYPNPVVNGIVGLKFNNMPEGIYNVQVVNLSGQQVAKEVITNSSESNMQNIILGKNINKGVYQVEVIGPDNSKTFLKLLNY